VLEVLRESSNRVGRVDRDLQEVIDAEVYILEEVAYPRQDKASALESLIKDFNFVLENAL
jgi:hypothetical protein